MELIKQARNREKSYEWLEAVEIYHELVTKYLDEKQYIKAAEIYKKIGDLLNIQANNVNEPEKLVSTNKAAENAYQKAFELFKKLGFEALTFECKAETLLLRGLRSLTISEAKECFQASYELFLKSKEIYSDKTDELGIARTLRGGYRAIFYIFFGCEDPIEIENRALTAIDLAIQCWKISKELKIYQFLVDALFKEYHMSNLSQFIIPFKQDKFWLKILQQQKERVDETLLLVKENDDSRILAIAYLASGDWYCNYGYYFAENDKDQKKFGDIGLNYLQKSIRYARLSRDKEILVYGLCRINYYSLFLGKFRFMQKRIEDDINENEKLAVAYGGLFSPYYRWLNLFAHILQPIYYANIAQRSFLNINQRKTYALKAINSGHKCIEIFKLSSPLLVPVFQFLTWAYAQLVYLTEEGKHRDKYLHGMIQNAKIASEISQGYKGGLAKAGGYSSLYRSYKTQADIAETEEIKVGMLKSTIDAQEKYMEHAIESRTGILGAYLRLGTLYEELGIITKKTEMLTKARELFINSANEAFNKGYDSYAATAYEHNARIEDRLGLYKNAANNYEKAQQLHAKSLDSIHYSPLKRKIEEKISYANAWYMIENAKFYHKQENHLKSKECYENAFQLLESLEGFKFEAPYYSAWAILEEAEEKSKQEEHHGAIDQYEFTKKSFNNALKILENTLTETKEKLEVDRISKLIKVAKVRKEYCSAKANLENARFLAKDGKNMEAADRFASAASIFRNLCGKFKVKSEREELEATYHLCRAWEDMELAEKHKDPNRFAEASNLFIKASHLFHESKLKFLALGNSAFCQALEMGIIFDEKIEIQQKAQLYPNIKVKLRKAAESYEKGGFKNGSDWALATSTYFDATWHILRADQEMNLVEKEKLLKLGSNMLESTAKLFKTAGYKEKEKEVLDRLRMVKKEEKIIFSALNSIRKPEMSSVTSGIIAPACPLETSQSPKLSETRIIAEEIGKKSEKESVLKLFFSYATADSKLFKIPMLANILITYSKIEEILYWEESLTDDIYDYMNKNLEMCDLLILFCSENAKNSEPVQMEWKSALKMKKKIIPVFIDEEDIPPLLTTKLGVQFNNKDIRNTCDKIFQLILKKMQI
jgi:hypothetical protein